VGDNDKDRKITTDILNISIHYFPIAMLSHSISIFKYIHIIMRITSNFR